MTAESIYQAYGSTDRAIDLDRQPVSWAQLVEAFSTSPCELEIGSGKGLFLQSAGLACPDTRFVGIELSAKFANRAAAKANQLGLSNVTVLRGDAKKFLQDAVPSNALAKVHVYFPDPWWRNKHKKRRVLNDQTLEDIQRVLRDGGEFHFWTDVFDYYEHVCNELLRLTRLQGPRYVPQRPAEHSMDYTTHFERRARMHHQPVYRAMFEKPENGM